MYTIIKERGEGKTTELINIAYANKWPIVCATITNANYVREQSEKMNKPIETICFNDFLVKRHQYHWKNVLMDEIIACIAVHFPEIKIATMSDYPLPTYEELLKDYFSHLSCC